MRRCVRLLLCAPAVLGLISSCTKVQQDRQPGQLSHSSSALSSCEAPKLRSSFAVRQLPGTQQDDNYWFGQACSDGRHYLVLWEANRKLSDGGMTQDLRAIRLRPDGRPIDARGLLITTTPFWVNGLCSFDGTNYVLAWQDHRGTDYDVYAARLGAAGPLLDDGGIAVTSAPGDQYPSGLASANGMSLVLWTAGTPASVVGARIDSSGQVLDPAGLPIDPGGGWDYRPFVGSNGTDFLVGWQKGMSSSYPPPQLYGRAVLRDGGLPSQPTDLTGGAATGLQAAGSLTWGGGSFLLSWSEQPQPVDAHNGILANRLSANGALIDPVPLTVVPMGQFLSGVGSVFDGSRHVIGCGAGYSGALVAGVDTQGTLVQSPTRISSPNVNAGAPLLDSDGHHTFAAFGSGQSLLQTFVAQDGGVERQPLPFVGRLSTATEPAAAWGPTALAVWSDFRSRVDYNIYAARLSPDSGSLDPLGIPVTLAPGDQIRAALAYGAGEYLAVWEDHRSGSPDIYAARINGLGSLLDDGGFPVSAGAAFEQSPAVTFDGIQFVVAWEDGRNGDVDVFAARVAVDGGVLDPNGIPVTASAGDQYAPAAAFNGENTLIAWQDYRSGAASQVYAAELSPGGQVLQTQGIHAAANTETQADPTLASNDAGALVVWVEGQPTPSLRASFWRGSDAGFGPSFPISVDGGAAQGAHAVFEGADYLVTWSSFDWPLTGNYRLVAARVSFDAGILDIGGIHVATSYDSYKASGLASNGAGTNVVVWSRPSGYYAPDELNAAFLLTPPFANGSSCSCDDGCASGFCTDGVCCESRCNAPDGGGRCLSCSLLGGATANGVCTVLASGTTCRQASDVCDAPGTCDGVSAGCPFDTLRDAGTLCRPAQNGQCDFPEYCTGASAACPGDEMVDAGTTCDAGNGCIVATCSAGRCVGTWRQCPGSPCSGWGSCNSATGRCVNPAYPDGTQCMDPLQCTVGICLGGACDAGTQSVCATPQQCQRALCNGNGQCLYLNQPDGTACNDGNACSQTDVCDAGTCSGSFWVDCPDPSSCQVGICNAGDGGCAAVPIADGTGCDDGDPCTESDTCSSGICAGAAVSCPTRECLVGACTPDSGACEYAPTADGTECDGGNCSIGLCLRMDAGEPSDGGAVEVDAGEHSDSGFDAGKAPDSGTGSDAGADAGFRRDAGGEPDGGFDAGERFDAGEKDGGDDAGETPDAGDETDGGSGAVEFDGGLGTDAGDNAPSVPASPGCGCSSSAPPLGDAFLVFLVILLRSAWPERLRRRLDS